jgi:hypothetical protein
MKWIDYNLGFPKDDFPSKIFSEAYIKLPSWCNDGCIQDKRAIRITIGESILTEGYVSHFWAFNRGVKIVEGGEFPELNIEDFKKLTENRFIELFSLNQRK